MNSKSLSDAAAGVRVAMIGEKTVKTVGIHPYHDCTALKRGVNESATTPLLGLFSAAILTISPLFAGQSSISYPQTRQTNQVDDYHGEKVADPYRWLEDDNANETKQWVETQNRITFGFLEQIPQRK